jgi:uncharacterized membrane protein YhaH (DUF805 family)
MDVLATIIALFFSVIMPVAALVILIYVIVRRIEDRKRENFEDRDN